MPEVMKLLSMALYLLEMLYFKKLADNENKPLFIFRYRAIYTEERLHLYMSREIKDKVIRKLVDI